MTTTFYGVETEVHELMKARGVAREFLVMVGHAGRADRTGAKVHVASATLWQSGNFQVGATRCSANGQLRGALVTGDAGTFDRVTCKRCGAGPEPAARRNAAAAVHVVEHSR